ncbi:hypothetical protein ACF07S_24445 [Streptomyces sp. NPDC016640]|uniref:hypothetical protein n=1 Tax=Streptomyces sp. NPDC016640 TaxID=3364969 RepID=UPI0036FAC270
MTTDTRLATVRATARDQLVERCRRLDREPVQAAIDSRAMRERRPFLDPAATRTLDPHCGVPR